LWDAAIQPHWPAGGVAACGLTAEGPPVGLQVVGPKFAERAVLETSLAIEALVGFGRERERAMAAH
jgi:Asp-tRNA(Asn)/Glu-tRNA(Gln) amidotransferase A subunit family amidase